MIHMVALLTSRNCTSPSSPSSDTHAYAASLCRKSWHNVISSLLNNDPIFHGFCNTTQNKKWINSTTEKGPSQSASRLWQRRNQITYGDKSIDMNNFQWIRHRAQRGLVGDTRWKFWFPLISVTVNVNLGFFRKIKWNYNHFGYYSTW